MRRITVRYAKPGMVLGLPVFNNFGKQLLKQFTKLNEKRIKTMAENGVHDIFIRDSRVADVVVVPLFSPQTEGLLASAFRKLMQGVKKNQKIDGNELNDLHVAVTKMVEDMTPNIIGDINVSCSIASHDYIYVQPVKTAALSLAMGHKIGIEKDDLVALGMVSILKDICLDEDLFFAAESREGADSPRLRGHPVAAYKLLLKHDLTDGVIAESVLQHHEQWNGTGYSQGLKDEEISPYARITALADAFVDLLANRPGEQTYMPHEAIEYIMAFSGDQFDPDLVELFVRQIPSYPSGLTVQLSTGESGIVVNPKLGFIARPMVRIIHNPGPFAKKDPYDVDLSKAEFQRTLITKVLGYD